MGDRQRTAQILVVTKRLLSFVAISLLILTVIFAASTVYLDDRLWITGLCMECGIIGGFVSIQQRLHTVQDDELELLANSWYSILLVPIYGGIFSLVLYLIFLSGLIRGQLFPDFNFGVSHLTSDKDVVLLLKYTLPATGPDFAKLLFWSFVAGFSERFVPQIIQRVTNAAQDAQVFGEAAKPSEASRDGEGSSGSEAANESEAPGEHRA